MAKTMSLADAKAHLSEVVTDVATTHERVTITRHGHAEAIVVAPDDLDALEETLDIMSDPEAMRQIAEAEREVAAGKGMNKEEFRQWLRESRG